VGAAVGVGSAVGSEVGERSTALDSVLGSVLNMRVVPSDATGSFWIVCVVLGNRAYPAGLTALQFGTNDGEEGPATAIKAAHVVA